MSQAAARDARARHLVAANGLVREAKQDPEWALVYRPIDLMDGGFVAISDAGLGGINYHGGDDGE
eukprot:5061496-Lingulodinium_polyedra.AAC.1